MARTRPSGDRSSTCARAGVELVIINAPECIELMQDFIAAKPELWNEDIGV